MEKYKSPFVWDVKNAVLILRDYCDQVGRVAPVYTIVEAGHDNNVMYKTVLYIDKPIDLNIESVSKSKHYGQQDAAVKACNKLWKDKLLDIDGFSIPNIDTICSNSSDGKPLKRGYSTSNLDRYQSHSLGDCDGLKGKNFSFSSMLSNPIFYHSKLILKHSYRVNFMNDEAHYISKKCDKGFRSSVELPMKNSKGTKLYASGYAASLKQAQRIAAYQACLALDGIGKLIVPNSVITDKQLSPDGKNIPKHNTTRHDPKSWYLDNVTKNPMKRHLSKEDASDQALPSKRRRVVNEDAEKVLKPLKQSDLFYVYMIKFSPEIEHLELEHMKGRIFDGFELFCNIQLEIPTFSVPKQKIGNTRVSHIHVELLEKKHLSVRDFELLKEFHQFFFEKVLKHTDTVKDGSTSLLECFHVLPHFSLRDEGGLFQKSGSILQDEEVLKDFMHGRPVTPLLKELCQGYSFEDLRRYESTGEYSLPPVVLTNDGVVTIPSSPQCVIDYMGRSLFGRSCMTTYNKMTYFISSISFTETVSNLSRFYTNRPQISDHFQPIFGCNMKTVKSAMKPAQKTDSRDPEDKYEEDVDDIVVVLSSSSERNTTTTSPKKASKKNPVQKDQHGPLLIPEFCNILPFSMQMYELGTHLLPYFSYIASIVGFFERLETWERDMGMSFTKNNFKLLFKEVLSEISQSVMGLTLYSLQNDKAFTHKSFSNAFEKANVSSNYERLEFFGDAVVDFVVSDYLFKTFPYMREGQLSRNRTRRVSNRNLAKVSRSIGLDKLLLFSVDSLSVSMNNAADVFESFVGALSLSQGIHTARDFIKRYILNSQEDTDPDETKSSEEDKQCMEQPWSSTEEECEGIVYVKTNIECLQDKLGYTFSNIGLLEKALTHQSVNPSFNNNYERLEWIGDSILKYLTTIHLFKMYPNATEEELNVRRSSIIRNETLVEISMDLGLDKYIMYSGEEKLDKHNKALADVVESIIAAIYIDGGFEESCDTHCSCCREDISSSFMHRFVFKKHDMKILSDPKSELQKLIQSSHADTLPLYMVTEKKGTVIVQIVINNQIVSQAEEATMKLAERAAASIAIKNFRNIKF